MLYICLRTEGLHWFTLQSTESRAVASGKVFLIGQTHSKYANSSSSINTSSKYTLAYNVGDLLFYIKLL